MTKPWDQSVKDRICALWKDGLSAKQIAVTMVGEGSVMTRQAVIGIVHRSGVHLEPRVSTPRRSNGGYGPGKSKPKPPPPPVPTLPPELQAIVDAGAITLENLHPRMCKFPIGGVGAADFRFCGAAQKRGSVYCESHHKLCHTPFHNGATISAEDRKIIADMNRKSGSQRAFG